LKENGAKNVCYAGAGLFEQPRHGIQKSFWFFSTEKEPLEKEPMPFA
jgi:hypothetical protein